MLAKVKFGRTFYMTDPQIFTFEPTLAKGAIVGDNGEPRVFCHECADVDKGKPMEEFISAARLHNAWPMVIPVSLYYSETNGSTPLCGGSFFIKSLESRRI